MRAYQNFMRNKKDKKFTHLELPFIWASPDGVIQCAVVVVMKALKSSVHTVLKMVYQETKNSAWRKMMTTSGSSKRPHIL